MFERASAQPWLRFEVSVAEFTSFVSTCMFVRNLSLEMGIRAVIQRCSGGGQVECHLVGSRSDAVGDMGRAGTQPACEAT